MSCSIALNTRIVSETPNGYFVHLGRSATTQIDNSSNIVNDNGDLGFGILDALDNGFNAETANDNIVTNNPYTLASAIGVTRFTPLPYNTSINFNAAPTGFYGFLYVVGDINVDGDIDSIIGNCGDIEAFEIEVVTGSDIGSADNTSVSYCESAVSYPLNLFTIAGIAMPSGFTGTWSLTSGSSLGTLNPTTGVITGAVATVGTRSYTLNISRTTSTHSIGNSCCSTASVVVTINITDEPSSGLPNNIAVCN